MDRAYNQGCCPCCNTPIRWIRDEATQSQHIWSFQDQLNQGLMFAAPSEGVRRKIPVVNQVTFRLRSMVASDFIRSRSIELKPTSQMPVMPGMTLTSILR